MEFDRLKTMFELQIDFQNLVGNSDKIYQREINTDFVKESIISLIDELMEALRETPWKPWKKDQKCDEVKMKEEIIDAWHFLINLSMAAGMNSDEVFSLFLEKNRVNNARQHNQK